MCLLRGEGDSRHSLTPWWGRWQSAGFYQLCSGGDIRYRWPMKVLDGGDDFWWWVRTENKSQFRSIWAWRLKTPGNLSAGVDTREVAGAQKMWICSCKSGSDQRGWHGTEMLLFHKSQCLRFLKRGAPEGAGNATFKRDSVNTPSTMLLRAQVTEYSL